MNGFDIALLVLVGLLMLLGLLKGLTRILIGISALVLAFLAASRFHEPLAERLGAWLDWRWEVLHLAGYLAIFFGVMLAGGLAAFAARRLLAAAMLGWADRLAGAALGLVMAALVAALVVLPVVAYSPLGGRALRGSVLAPYVTVVADLANALAPQDLSRRYREQMDGLRRYWRERWLEGAGDARPQA